MRRGGGRLCATAASRCSSITGLVFGQNRQGFSTMTTVNKKVLTEETINPNVKTMEYAVRGPLVIRAVNLEGELAKGAQKPFSSVIKANIGDCHAMGQPAITFIRQVVACVTDPSLMDTDRYPSDVCQHAKTILKDCGGGSVGAYSQSNGVPVIRQHVAEYIQARDGGIPSDPESICLSGGASESIRNVLKLFINRNSSSKIGVMVPIPQYPLYSATIEEYGLGQIGYYLDEENKWALDTSELERSLNEAKTNGLDVRVICVINPGNPTGQVLSLDNIKTIIKFAHKHNLYILADEVYQDNVYAEGSQFHSFKKVLMSMGEPYSKMELASFHSVSKGYMGECGMRGGYVEFVNLDENVFALYKKMCSAKLCSTVVGQAVIDCVVNPPKKGDPSYEKWAEERAAVLKSLRERALLVKEAYDSIEGISCNPVMGAMYAFPRLHLPQKAIEKAKSVGQEPDFFYAMQLLEATGVCIVPGSGFGQKPGTYHFRTTILPQIPMMKDMLQRFKTFHMKFMAEYK